MNKISKDTILRTVVLVITLINTVLTAFGKNPLPFSETDIYQAISTVCTVAASIWAWWKNNSFTKAAIEADKYMHELKDVAKQVKVDAKAAEPENKEDELK